MLRKILKSKGTDFMAQEPLESSKNRNQSWTLWWAEWLNSMSYNQWLDAQVETGDRWCPSGASTAQHLCWWQGQADWGQPQQVHWWHLAVWCGQHCGGKGAFQRDWTCTRESWEMDPYEPCEVQQGQAQGPAPGSRRPQAQIQAGRRMDWE